MVYDLGESVSLVNSDQGRYWGKYDAKSRAIEHLSSGKPLFTLKLNFEGFIFLYHCTNDTTVFGKEMFSFLVEQINKLK